MEWLTAIKEALGYMEKNLLTIEGVSEVSEHVNMSSLYLQRGFQMMTGYTVGEYIRNRRLYFAALDLVNTEGKIIDIAYTYGYETPESFTKAYSRFHNVTPSETRRTKKFEIFLPLELSIIVQGGNKMNYRVEKKNAFQVIGFKREFTYENGYREIPRFWDEAFKNVSAKRAEELKKFYIGEFGICLDNNPAHFDYMIGGEYKGGTVPSDMEVVTIPESLWAVFECEGPLPGALQSVNTKIWKEWLPGNAEYELSGNITVEWYSEGDVGSMTYKSAIWIPVKHK